MFSSSYNVITNDNPLSPLSSSAGSVCFAPSSIAIARLDRVLVLFTAKSADSFKNRKDSIESRDRDWDRITTGLKAACY